MDIYSYINLVSFYKMKPDI